MKIVKKATLRNKEVSRLCNRDAAPSPEIAALVSDILKNVKENGMKAVKDYAQRFDGLKGNLKASASELEKAAAQVTPSLARDLKAAIRKVKEFHKHQKENSWTFKGKDGEVLGQRIRPMHRVGVYVPGGEGVYPSTLIMNAVPAIVAGVKDIVVVNPARDGIQPSVAFCALELGISEFYKIGGAQAVGLLAYGAGSGASAVKGVDKIVGPANVYAAYAKKEVFGTVDIDMIAGPSEILVMADDTADPDWVAADLLSQAEHGSGYEAAVLITDSKLLAENVALCVEEQVSGSPREEKLRVALERYGRILLVEDWDVGVDIANYLAPEHLEVMTADADKLAQRLDNAGAIFIGPYSSEPVGDYFAGPNHVLPTNGTARFSSPLGVYDFVKRTSIIKYSAQAMAKHGKKIVRIAEDEGFVHHARAVAKRLS
jgi:histidinol dehydrogenase